MTEYRRLLKEVKDLRACCCKTVNTVENFADLPSAATTPEERFYIVESGAEAGLYLVIDGVWTNVSTIGGGGYVNVETTDASRTLDASGFYTFTGTNSTFSLPTVSALRITTIYFIKNRGSGALTIDVVGGGSTIYDSAAVASIVIPAGESRTISQDSTYWNVH